MNKAFLDTVAALDGLMADGLLTASGGFGVCAIDGRPELIPPCTQPLTGRNLFDTMTTEDALFRRGDHASPARQIGFAPQIRLDDLNSKTTACLFHD
ncbi:MAG: hypothetical protein KGP14_15600 [Betaproteobacteria bacterium]|nr:hypothetical protein [Betaproteobacteria bacterium]